MSADDVEQALMNKRGWVHTQDIAKILKVNDNFVLRGLKCLEERNMVKWRKAEGRLGFEWKLK